MAHILLPIVTLLTTASAPGTAPAPAPACPLSEVAGAPGENHLLYRGVSPDGRSIAVGWDRKNGEAIERGAYLLDLRSGKRTPLPHLNNAPSFSPNGRWLYFVRFEELSSRIHQIRMKGGDCLR